MIIVQINTTYTGVYSGPYPPRGGHKWLSTGVFVVTWRVSTTTSVMQSLCHTPVVVPAGIMLLQQHWERARPSIANQTGPIAEQNSLVHVG